jgi:transposase-like protein
MSWGGAGRKRDYRLLDEIGFDVVDARLEICIRTARIEEKGDRYPENKAFKAVAQEFDVNDFNLRMWWRRKRTIIFLTDTDPAEILDLIASGLGCADLALAYDVSVKVVEEWVRTHAATEDIAAAKDAMAEMKFARVRREIEEAETDIAIKRALAMHSVDKHVAAANSRRYSEDKNIRINAGASTAMEISFIRKREPEEEPSK